MFTVVVTELNIVSRLKEVIQFFACSQGFFETGFIHKIN